jgi:hypothetical protein
VVTGIIIGVVIQAVRSHNPTGRDGGGMEDMAGDESVHGPD